MHQTFLHPKDCCLHVEIKIKEMGGDVDATRETGVIKVMTRCTGKIRSATSVVKKDIHNCIAQRLKKINTMITKSQVVPALEQAWRSYQTTSKICPGRSTWSTHLPTNLKEAKSDLSECEDEDKSSYFYMAKINFGKSDFKFVQLGEEFEPRIASLFIQTSGRNVGIKTKLDLKEVIFLYRQSRMDLFYNWA